MVRHFALPLVLAISILAAIACGGAEADNPSPGDANTGAATGVADLAPEIDGIADWYNSEPLSLAGLRGRTVLLVFWEDT